MIAREPFLSPPSIAGKAGLRRARRTTGEPLGCGAQGVQHSHSRGSHHPAAAYLRTPGACCCPLSLMA